MRLVPENYAFEVFVDSASDEEQAEDEEASIPTTSTTNNNLPGATRGSGLPAFKDQVLEESTGTQGGSVRKQWEPTKPQSSFQPEDSTHRQEDTSGTSTTSLQADGSRDGSSRESSLDMSGLTVRSLIPSFADRNQGRTTGQEEHASSMGISSTPDPIAEDQPSDEESSSDENGDDNNDSVQPLEIEASLVRESYVMAEVVNQRFGARCVVIALLIAGICLAAVLSALRVSSSRNDTTQPLPQSLRPTATVIVTDPSTIRPTVAPTPQPTLIPVEPVSWVAVQELEGPSDAVNFGASLGTTNKGWKVLIGYNGGLHFWEKWDDSSSTLFRGSTNQTVIGRLSFDGLVAVYIASDPINGTLIQIVRQSEDETSWNPYKGGIPQESIRNPSERYWLDRNDQYGEFLALAQQEKNMIAVGGVGFVKVFRLAGSLFQLAATLQKPNVLETHQFGFSVDVDAYGNLLVVGAPSVNPCCTGMVFLYRWNGSNFNLIDQLEGMPGAGRFGHSVKLSGDGSLLLVSGTLLHNGHVLTFRLQNDRLIQTGSLLRLYDTSTTNGFGTSLGSDFNGTNIAIGHPFLGDTVGTVFIYQWNGEDWAERGDAIVGPGSSGGCFGSHLIMSREGDKVIVAAPKDENGRVYLIEPFVPENPFACRVCNDGAAMLNPDRVIPQEVISPDFKQITGSVNMTSYIVDLVGQNKYLPSACPIIEELFYSFCGCEGAPPPTVCNLCEEPDQFPSNYDKTLPQSVVQKLYPNANFQVTCGNVFEAGRSGSFVPAGACNETVAQVRSEAQAFCGCSR